MNTFLYLFIISFSLKINNNKIIKCFKTENTTVINKKPITKIFREMPNDPLFSCYQRDDLLWVCFMDCDFLYDNDDSY